MRPADLLIVNARPWSDGAPLREADAIAVADGRVLAIGRSSALEGLAGPGSRRIDARGGTVTPGLTDAHLHLVAWARALREVRLEGLRTRRAVVAAVEAAAGQARGDDPAVPLIGRGWQSDAWEASPHHDALDPVSPDRAVLLHSKDFHAVWANRAAMVAAGIHPGAESPPGGLIERAPSGAPTGVFRENAVRLFDGLVPAPTVAHDLEGVRTAAEQLLALGVTSIHDFEGDAEAEVLRALALGAGPRVRVLMHLPRVSLDRMLASGVVSGGGDDRFCWGAIKLFADGTLGSRTAAVLEPYDGTEEMGLTLLSPDELKALTGRAVRGGLSVAIHAIGDRAVRSTLDAFEACGPSLGRLRLPPRIEHAQLVHDDDLPRFAALGVAASVQPSHCTSDRPLAERFWKSRSGRCYPWRTLLDRGARVAFGSDAPVEPPSPAHGIHAAVTRESRDGEGGTYVPGQRIALDEALTAYTEAPARLSGSWPGRGRLGLGCAADLVVWDADLHHAPAAELWKASPWCTVLGGEVLYERPTPVAAGGSR